MMQCLIFLFIAGISQLNGLPYASSNSKTADYYADDYPTYSSDDYPNGDGDDSINSHLGEDEKVIHVTPVMQTKNSDEWTNEGELVKLHCEVDTLDGYVLMWLKDGKQISVGKTLLTHHNRRMQLRTEKNRNTITITNAEPEDAGNYVCKVSVNSPKKKVQVEHKVRIRVAPVIESNPANGQLIVMEGETASLGCKQVVGNPKPEIKWRRKARKFVDGKEEMIGNQLTFFKVTRHHSGIYNCSADNGFSKTMPSTASKTITLDVHHKPKIVVEQTFIHTQEDERTEIVCIVHASPRAKIEWFKNGEVMTVDQGTVSKIGNRHTLELPEKELQIESNFGVYTCKATNKYGSDEETVVVSGKAGPPSFKTNQEGTEDHTYPIEWVAESTTPITSFRLEYRVDDGDRSYLQQRMQKSYYSYITDSDDIFNSIEDSNEIRDKRDGKIWNIATNVSKPISNGENMYAGRYTLVGLSPSTNYVVRIFSENDYGFSRPLPRSYFYFGTKGAAPLQQPSTGTSSGVSFFRNEGGYKSATIIISILTVSLYSHWLHLAFNSRSFLLSCL